MVDSIDRSIDQILGNVESQRQGHIRHRGDRVRINDEDLLSDYERLRLENIRQNAAFMESLGIPDAVFAINESGGARLGRRRLKNIRDNDEDNDDYHGNSVRRIRSSSRNVPSVPTRQMPSRAAKLGEKRYYVPGEEDIREEED